MNRISLSDFISLFGEAVRKHQHTEEPLLELNKSSLDKINSYLEMPFQNVYGAELYPTIYDKSAILLYLIIKNHPLSNGNKRIAFLLMYYLLYINDIDLKMDESEAYKLTKYVAESNPYDKDEVITYIKNKLNPNNMTPEQTFLMSITKELGYVISLKKLGEKKKIIKMHLANMDEYTGDEWAKKITTSNLKYALQQTTPNKINDVLKISLNALKSDEMADGGRFETIYNVAYSSKSGKGMVAKIPAKSEEEAKAKLLKEMRASSTFDKIITVFKEGGTINEYKIGDHVMFNHGRDGIKKGEIIDKNANGYVIFSGYSQIGVDKVDVIEKAKEEPRKKMFGIFKDGGKVEEPVKAKIEYNDYWKRWQVYVDGSLYEEFMTKQEAEHYVNHGGWELYKDGGLIESAEVKAIKEKIAKAHKNSFIPESVKKPLIAKYEAELAKLVLEKGTKEDVKDYLEVPKGKQPKIVKVEPKHEKDAYSKNMLKQTKSEIEAAIKSGKVKELYDEWEDENNHKANVLLQAMVIKDKTAIKQMEDIYIEHTKTGHMPDALYKKIRVVSKKINPKYDALIHNKKPANKVKAAPKKSVVKDRLDEKVDKLVKTGKYDFLKTQSKESIKRDEKRASKPVGWRFKGKSTAKPTKKEIASKSDNIYYEDRPDRSDVSKREKLVGGGSLKDIGFENSNLYLYGFGKDINGNSVIKVGFPNQKAFSIQINNPNFRDSYSNKTEKLSDLSQENINRIEKEVIEYVKNYGSKDQKLKLKTYDKMALGGLIVTPIKSIPNLMKRVEEGKVTYRGLGMGKLSDDFYKIAGTNGTRIKVDGKEYFITDAEFDSFSRDKDGRMQIRFAAPARKHENGGTLKQGWKHRKK